MSTGMFMVIFLVLFIVFIWGVFEHRKANKVLLGMFIRSLDLINELQQILREVSNPDNILGSSEKVPPKPRQEEDQGAPK